MAHSAASVQATCDAINAACKAQGGAAATYSCKTVSWDDACRGAVGGNLSCWGGNITDTRLYSKSGTLLYTVRCDNWNEKLGKVNADSIALVVGNHTPPTTTMDDDKVVQLEPITLKDFLKNAGHYAAYAGVDPDTNLYQEHLDQEISIRFQTTFLPVAAKEELATLEFCTEAYNYNTTSDDNPRNAVLLCTTQGIAFEQDGAGAKKLFHHAIDPNDDDDDKNTVHRYWLEVERSQHKVGGAQLESKQEAANAAARGKATASVIGIPAMGTRFNVLMTIQIPVEQTPRATPEAYWEKQCLYAPSLMSYDFCDDDFIDEEDCEEEECGLAAAPEFAIDGAMKKKQYEPEICMAAAQPLPEDDEEEYSDEVGLPSGWEEVVDSTSGCNYYSSASERKPEKPAIGTANAARVSRGSEEDTWGGVSNKTPKRDATQHITVTVVIYNTVAGGVPSARDVQAAIEDMEHLYEACSWKGKLAEEGAGFMKSELTVADAMDIDRKKSEQPYAAPKCGLVQNGNVFPSSAS